MLKLFIFQYNCVCTAEPFYCETVKYIDDLKAAGVEAIKSFNEQRAGTKSTSYDIVKTYVSERIGKFSKQEVLVSCPSLGSSSVESALKKLVDDGTLIRIGAGRKTLYARADSV